MQVITVHGQLAGHKIRAVTFSLQLWGGGGGGGGAIFCRKNNL